MKKSFLFFAVGIFIPFSYHFISEGLMLSKYVGGKISDRTAIRSDKYHKINIEDKVHNIVLKDLLDVIVIPGDDLSFEVQKFKKFPKTDFPYSLENGELILDGLVLNEKYIPSSRMMRTLLITVPSNMNVESLNSKVSYLVNDGQLNLDIFGNKSEFTVISKTILDAKLFGIPNNVTISEYAWNLNNLNLNVTESTFYHPHNLYIQSVVGSAIESNIGLLKKQVNYINIKEY